MPHLTRRKFAASFASAAIAASAKPRSQNQVDAALRAGIAKHQIPAAVGAAASKSEVLYTGAFGTRDSSGVPVTPDTIFQIASMTKPVTTVAALQLVEQGKVDLSTPVSKHLPELADLPVLDGFDSSGKPLLHACRTPITLHHLLTHTSGLCYDIWDEKAFQYSSRGEHSEGSKPGPLMFEPGARWQYGESLDWAGRLVERLSGTSLEEYFQAKILKPLGMNDTSYILPEAAFPRLAGSYQHESNGAWKADERRMPRHPKQFNGGGGLYSTAGDYVTFMRMILNRGAGSNGERILKPETVNSMFRNQIGSLGAGKMKSYRTALSSDVDMQPGQTERWGLGFLLNTIPYAGGRREGSGAWGGLFNTYFWIDPKADRCGVLMMQFLPFADKDGLGLLDEFERAVYRM